MALTGTDRGTGTHNTSATSFTLAPASNFAAGSWAVLCIAADNSAASGSSNNITSVADTNGNTWTKRVQPLYDPGAANAGIQGAIFTTPMNGGTLTTGSTITVSFGANTVAKAWTLQEVVRSGSGYTIEYVTGGVNTGSATASPTVNTASIANTHMVIGALFNEYGTAQTITQDGDTSNGNWSTQQTTEIGTTAAGVSVSSQRKIVTAAATQTYNPTLATSSDVILAWIALREVLALTATGIATAAPTVGTPVLNQAHALTGTGIATAAASVGTPAISQAHALTATGIATAAPTVDTPALTENAGADNLTASDLATGAPTVGSPAITQAHALTATGVATAAPTVGSPAVTQAHQITAAGIATAVPTVGAPVVTQAHSLTATGIATAAPTVGAPALTENAGTNNLSADDLATGAPTVGSPALSQNHQITATGIAAAAPTADSPALSQAHALTASGIATDAPTLGTPTLDGAAPVDLVANGIATGAPTLGTPELSEVANFFATPTTGGGGGASVSTPRKKKKQEAAPIAAVALTKPAEPQIDRAAIVAEVIRDYQAEQAKRAQIEAQAALEAEMDDEEALLMMAA